MKKQEPLQSSKKRAIVFGAGGIGGGFIKGFQKRGYETWAQWRNEKKRVLLEKKFPHLNYIYSDLVDEVVLRENLQEVTKKHYPFDVMVLAMGDAKLDSNKKFKNDIELSIQYHTDVNLRTKEVAMRGLLATLPQQPVTDLIIVSSHASTWTEQEAREKGEIGYYTAMKLVNEFAQQLERDFPNRFRIHVLKTTPVETNLLENLRVDVRKESAEEIIVGEHPDSYAKHVLDDLGL